MDMAITLGDPELPLDLAGIHQAANFDIMKGLIWPDSLPSGGRGGAAGDGAEGSPEHGPACSPRDRTLPVVS